MKIFVKEDNGFQETEVIIRCYIYDKKIEKLKRHIEEFSLAIQGVKEGEQYKLSLKEIYYMEVVDGRTYIYTENEMYNSNQSLINLENTLKGSTFVRISKTVLLNVDCLKAVAPMEKHRMLATLKNEEKIIVGRTYILGLKEKLQEGLQ